MRPLLAIYADPANYPPTVNSTKLLAKRFTSVKLLGRCLKTETLKLPKNAKVQYTHECVSQEELKQLSYFRKLSFFYRFFKYIKKEVKTGKYTHLLCYDLLALLAGYLALRSTQQVKLWFHSHDVIHNHTVSKYSLMGLAKWLEPTIFKRIDIFTLPVKERLTYYPLSNRIKHNSLVMPNYPMKELIAKESKVLRDNEFVNLIYQGSLGDNHGFEQLIDVLETKVNNRQLTLTLIGPIQSGYKESLLKRAEQLGVTNYVSIKEGVPYSKLHNITRAFDVGIATHLPGKKAIYNLGATSSNKIYEYAAAGLPVLLFDTEHYQQYLAERDWAFFTDLTCESVVTSVSNIIERYEGISTSAIRDITNELNYDSVFNQTIDQILA